MSSRLELSPADLDRLEDAIEDLEHVPLETLDPSDPVEQRLVEFRELLVLSREALPMEEVPAGILDGVLAEARQAAVASPTPAERAPWWSRWTLWGPALAFAGSAAALLLLFGPLGSAGDAPAASSAEVAAQSPAADKAAAEPGDADRRLALAPASPRADDDPLARDEAGRGAGLAISGKGRPEPEPEEQPQEELEAVLADDEVDERAAEKSKDGDDDLMSPPALGGVGASTRKKAAGRSGGGAPPSEPAPAPASKPEPKKSAPGASKGANKRDAPAKTLDDLWGEIGEADRQRRKGNCGLAEFRYNKARKSDDAGVRSRALAGLGLCKAARGSTGAAKKLFDQARAADPSVAGFIDAELAMVDGAPSSHPPSAAEQNISSKE